MFRVFWYSIHLNDSHFWYVKFYFILFLKKEDETNEKDDDEEEETKVGTWRRIAAKEEKEERIRKTTVESHKWSMERIKCIQIVPLPHKDIKIEKLFSLFF